MILISTTQLDPVIDTVIDWITFNNANIKIVRINDDKDYQIAFEGKEIYLIVDNEKINIGLIDSFWYRRGRIRYKINKKHLLTEVKEKEEILLEEYINFLLSKVKSINSFKHSEPNKLIVLETAKNVDLLIPETFIFEQDEPLNKLKAEKTLITKSYLASSLFDFQDISGIIYTNALDDKDEIPKKFLPSLFQENVSKKYELRIFFFNDRFWSMAIFSQLDDQTKSDFRVYNNEKPNRTVPYNLPNEIEQKLRKLMNNLSIDSGSIDMIVTEENKFVFLEVNPVGQFGMVSYPCNYNIEKEIANYLCHEN